VPSEATTRLAAILRPSGGRIPLAEAALWIAAEEYLALDVEAYLDRLDELAERARPRVAPFPSAERVVRFNHFLFRELGFAGNSDDYNDPRNSFLNEVLDRRVGIPITLALVYTEIGGRIGLPVVGVGFPGHFLVRWVGEQPALIDPFFFGKVVTRDECAERLRAAYGPEASMEERLLAPATPREILARMLRNLKVNYLARGDLSRALSAVDRTLIVTPDDPGELRDRGTLYFRLECFAAALADFERFLELAPRDPMAEGIRSRLPELRREAARLQ
jgi:regulator of sirC expression with transglutaminase-like and TPR domain